MKRFLLLFFMFVLAMTAVAQRTQKITYQAVVRDAGNRLVVYTPVRVDVTITSSTGSYFESLRDTTNANGLMYVLIGGNPGFEDIDWVEAVIKTVITIDGGESVSDEVTVTAVPLALQASYATNVSPMAPTIVAVYNQIQADSLALANQIAAERAHLDDTLSHYLMKEVQVLSISNDTIYLTGGSFVKLPAGFSGNYNDLVNKPTNVSAFTNDAGYLTQEVQVLSVSNDTLYLTGGSWVKLPQGFSGDYNDLVNKPTNVSAFNNDAGYLTSDSAVIVNLNTNVTNLQGDVTNLQGDVTNLQSDVTNLQNADNALSSRITTDSAKLANNYYDKTDINDTLSHYLMKEVQVLSIGNDTIYLTGGSFVKLPAGFSGDYNDLINKPTKSDLCDSVKPCVTDWISDSTRMVFDSLHTYYITSSTLKDTVSAIRGALQDTAIAIRGALIDTAAAIRSDIPDVSGFATKDELRADSTVLAGKMRADSTVMAQQIRVDSLALHNALIDTAAAIRDALIDTAAAIRAAMPVVNDGTLTITVNGTDNSFTANQSGSTNVNIDLTPYATKVELHNDSVALGTAISDLTAKVATDSLALVNRIATDSTALATRMDTLLKHVC
ncbi:MAG: hypothetical protein IKO62_06575, partial [Bacteroidales bacterium]|nr:hypothetical protein [Bacteroidales bacterium]